MMNKLSGGNRHCGLGNCSIFLLFMFASVLPARGLDFSGLLDTKLNFTSGAAASANNTRSFSYGIEEYANLRLAAGTDGPADFFAALNLIALSGNYLENAALSSTQGVPSSFLAASGYYAAMLEIERLYMHLRGASFDIDAGLFRQAFGFGQVWSPMDFLNTKNPLEPDARPKPALGAACAFYPADASKLTAFAAAPKNPFNADGSGFLSGLAFNQHWTRLDAEALYSYETAQDSATLPAAPNGLHRIGLSLRADIIVQLTLDSLYILNSNTGSNLDNLAASAGIDYSFLDGDLYLAAAYLFSGSASVTSNARSLTGFDNNNYIYASALCRFTSYTNAALAAVVCLDDSSCHPVISIETSPFQALTLSLQAKLPINDDSRTITFKTRFKF